MRASTVKSKKLANRGGHVFPPLALSRQVKHLLREEKVNLVLDVGAFHGDYCKLLRERIGYTGRIVSFEPSGSSFRALERTMKGKSAWRGFAFGLSDRCGVAILNNYPQREMFNSILRFRKREAQNYTVNLTSRFPERIRLRTIDRMWSEITDGIGAPRVFLKIDTQGHDVAVVQGATHHLDCIVGIQSELPAVEIYDGMTPMHKALAFYGKLGFAPIGFY